MSAGLVRTLTQRDFERFAVLSRDDDPIHCDLEFAAGTRFGATVAHGMFLYGLISAGLSELVRRPWLPCGQTLMFPAPAYAGETVRVEVQPDYEDGEFSVHTTVERDGATVATAQGDSAINDLEASIAQATPCEDKADPVVGATEAHDDWLGLRVGQRADCARSFTEADLDEYVDLCGDRNPLVAQAGAAARAGLPGRLVPAPLLCAMFSDLLGTRLPGRGAGWMKQAAQFHRPVPPGEALFASVQIVRLRPDKQLVDLRSTVTDARGAIVVSGQSLVLVRGLAAPLAAQSSAARADRPEGACHSAW